MHIKMVWRPVLSNKALIRGSILKNPKWAKRPDTGHSRHSGWSAESEREGTWSGGASGLKEGKGAAHSGKAH